MNETSNRRGAIARERPRSPLALALLVAAAGCAGSAQADVGLVSYAMSSPREGEGDTLRFAAFQVERYDSNFFRLADGVSPGGDGARSTVTSTTGVGVGIDKQYGLQRIVADFAVAHDFYSRYKNLDFTGHRLTSTYFWAVTPAVTGDLVFERSRLPTDFEFTQFRTSTNARTTQNFRLDVDWRASAALHPRLSAYSNEDTTDDPTFQVSSYKTRNVEASLIYDFRSLNRLQGYVRSARGNNTDTNQDPSLLINNDFNEREYGARASWRATGQLTADASIGHLTRTYTNFGQRNFEGTVGRLNMAYAFTGKTTFNLAASRTLNSSQTTFSSFYAEDLAATSLDYGITNKITIRPIYQFRRQAYRGSPFSVATPLTMITRDASLEVRLAALRSVDFSVALTRSNRTATIQTFQFVNRSASLLARVRF